MLRNFTTTGLLLLFFLTSSCKSMEIKQEASQASASYQKQLLQAKATASKSPESSIQQLNNLLQNYPENSLTDDTLFLLGEVLLKQNRNGEALRAYSRILDSKYKSNLDGRAVLRKASLFLKNGQEEEALRTLNFIKSHKIQDLSSIEKIETTRLPLLLKYNQYLDFLYASNNIIKHTTNATTKQVAFKQGLDVLKIKLSGSDTKKVLDTPALRIFHPQAVLNLSEYYFESNEPEQAIATLEKHSHLLQNPPYKNHHDELMMRGHIYTSPNNDVLGVILPLSGKYAFVGNQILKGLQYSLGLWSPSAKVKFKFAVVDSEGDPNQVALAFDELMKSDRPIAIVGGLVGKTAEVILNKSQEYRVPALILSQKEGLTKSSKYGFQSSQSLETYANLIASLAYDSYKLKKIAILHSKKNFSTRYAEVFANSFSRRGGEVSQIVKYDLNEKRAIPSAVKKVIGLLTPEGREEEYKEALTKWRKSSKSRGKTGMPKLEEILKPQVEFDALFVADGAKNGGLIASTLAYFDVEDQILLGTHLWNDPALLERGQRFIENAIFASSYFEPSILASQCGKEFLGKFQEPINPYIYRGIEVGTILNSVFGYFDIESRGALLTALKRTSLITHKCLPGGLVRQDHNFSSPLQPSQ